VSLAASPAGKLSVPGAALYGYFAFVMATGIVSIAAGLTGLGWISDALFGLNLAIFPVLCVLLALRTFRAPASVFADLRDHRRAPSLLATVAATCVLGNEVALTRGHQALVAGLWIAACVVWAGLIYGFFAAMTIRPEKPQLEEGLDGSWLLAVVATEALSILTGRAADAVAPHAPALFASLAFFLLGAGFYAILLIAIVQRWLFLRLRPDQLTAPYWINMGAAAIATLAGSRLISALGADPAVPGLRDFVLGTTVLFWSWATWWIPLLAILTVWRHRPGAVRFGYRPDNWSIVFPLGMYTTATWRLAHEIGLPFLEAIPQVFVWVALTAWVLSFAGMLRAALHAWRPRHSAL
jgi:tellurite resistance protein TehA-like permease